MTLIYRNASFWIYEQLTDPQQVCKVYLRITVGGVSQVMHTLFEKFRCNDISEAKNFFMGLMNK